MDFFFKKSSITSLFLFLINSEKLKHEKSLHCKNEKLLRGASLDGNYGRNSFIHPYKEVAHVPGCTHILNEEDCRFASS